MPKQPSASSTFRFILLLGTSGVGKTSLALTSERPYLIDCEGNQAAPQKVFAMQGLTPAWTYDAAYLSSKDESLPLEKRYDRFISLVEAYLKSWMDGTPYGETLVIDSATVISEMLQAKIKVNRGGKPADPMEQRDWGAFQQQWSNLVGLLRAFPCHVILICHEMREESNNGLVTYSLNMQGRTAQLLPAMATDVWRLVIEQATDPATKKRTDVRMIQTAASSVAIGMKSSVSMPDKWEATPANLRKALGQPEITNLKTSNS